MKKSINKRLQALKDSLKEQNLDGYIIPHSDEHLGEFIPPFHARLEWLTGFTGSAGNCFITPEQCILFVDGRYELQAPEQVAGASIDVQLTHKQTLGSWLQKNLKPGMRIGVDGWMHPSVEIDRYCRLCNEAGCELVFVSHNLVDAIWHDRQATMENAPVNLHPLKYAGTPHEEKIATICAMLKKRKTNALVVSEPDSLCWLLNLRGRDIYCVPIALCYGILHAHGQVELYIDQAKVPEDVKAHFGQKVIFRPYDDFSRGLRTLKGKTVWLDPQYNPYQVKLLLEENQVTIHEELDPCLLAKACKNPAEVEGARQAHMRDGAILADLFAWISQTLEAQQPLDELAIGERLQAQRIAVPEFICPSFATIVGAGPNGAKVHYRSTPATNRTIEKGDLLLIDAGAQYVDGTTDVTRVLSFCEPTAEQKRNFTLVLKGNMALATIRFPNGTSGAQLDAIARAPLWQAGLDYGHGTGHGVGSVSCVHEGPQRIAKAGSDTQVPLMPGMIVSNEPGYYKTGAYGLRLENLQVVHPVDEKTEIPLLKFDVLTMVPLGRRLIEASLLTPREQEWVDAYHVQVYAALKDRIAPETLPWLKAETAPLNG